jgi:hypothetical protein
MKRSAGQVRRLALILPLVLLTGLIPRGAVGQGNLEYEVKAAFLFNFTRFIDWPASAFPDAASPFTICILGKDPFGHVLDDVLKGEGVNGRPLTVRRISQAPAPQSCQVVFIEATGRALVKDLSSLGRGVLTVGEGDAFVREGGTIGFVIDSRRVRFDVNQAAAEAAGLKMSSKLLSVARAVKD